MRYIEDNKVSDKHVYVIAVLENFSRAMLASLLTPRQDLTAYLIVLRAAMREHGVPEGIVSDSGGIFTHPARSGSCFMGLLVVGPLISIGPAAYPGQVF